MFYGWAVLFVAAAGMFVSGAGQSFNFSVFVEPIERELGMTSTGVASAYGLATLGASFLLPYVGRLIDRYGPRRVLLAVSVALGAGCVAFSFVADPVTLTLGFAVLRFLGQGAMMLVCGNMVAQWFAARRGLALSLMTLGFAASMALYPPLGAHLMEGASWRDAWPWFGGLTLVLMVPLVLLLARDKPEDFGLKPDGVGRNGRPDDAGPQPVWAQPDRGLSLTAALRTPAFYIIAAGMFAISMLSTALHIFQVRILTSQGISDDTAALGFTVSAITMAAAMPLLGRLMDKVDAKPVFMAALFVQALSLLLASLATSVPLALAYSAVFGITNASSLVLASFIWPRYFGRRHLGAVQGTATTIVVVGASVGPTPLGAGYDLFGDFALTLQLLAVVPVALILLAGCLKVPAEMEPT